MALTEIQDYLKLLPKLKESREDLVWLTYDAGADRLYVNYKKPSHATDSELTDDDVDHPLRGRGGRGLHDSARQPA